MENQINPVNPIIQENQKTPPLKSKVLLIVLIAAAILIAGILAFLLLSKPPVGSASLSWNPNTEANLAGYKIYYGEVKRTGDCPIGGYPEKVDAGNIVAYKIPDLQPEKTYYFSVTSYNTAGAESCFSPEVNKKIEKAGLKQKMAYYFNYLKTKSIFK